MENVFSEFEKVQKASKISEEGEESQFEYRNLFDKSIAILAGDR